jgi:hypothetical protein
MPTIKNTDELVKRARNHLEADRFLQGEYVKATMNGDAEFQGCAIGCLVMDVDLKALKDLRPVVIKGENVESPTLGWAVPERMDEDEHGEWVIQFGGTTMIYTLEEQFGIASNLMTWAEAAFEDGTCDHHAAGEWVVSFAEALVPLEGVEITDDEATIARWRAGRLDTTIREDVIAFLEEKAAAVPA